MTPLDARVLRQLRHWAGMGGTTDDVRFAFAFKRGVAGQVLARLKAAGKVRRVKGRWYPNA